MRNSPSTLTRRRLLATAGSGSVLALAGCSAPAIETRRTDSVQFSPDGSDSLAVRNPNGGVTVTSGDGDAVAVEMTVRGYGVDESLLADVTVERSVSDGTLVLEATYPEGASRITTGLDVRMPQSMSLSAAETRTGGIEARGVGGDPTLRAGDGGVTARRVDGYVTLEATNGGVEARDVGGIDGATVENGGVSVDVPAVRGDTEIRTTNGGVEARVGPDVDAAFEVRASNGGVDVGGIELADATKSPSRVAGTLGDGGPSLTISAGNGGVEVRSLDS
ncbi:DUF4097 family beta strand repeat-containing protein [Halopelagius longus]|uniref:Uncharacterized protein n=1 Tax=Halopelagius longus TaxID=1236180 RepID=A0A1H1BWS3_9EURY|nr:hypothetical protein [Halopelagius longus]RDI70960.1 hypothetical protein DWB78_04030 [Halopelagius longus]SDQ56392.1 hypothetical protein SAMN05216278_1996 [Halopelagius longus]